MTLLRLDVTNFRNLNAVNLQPSPSGFNFFYGNNGSGKTSLLEAIYYLSLARSFRSTTVGRIIAHTADKFSVFAHILSRSEHVIPLGLERHQESGLKIRISGKDAHSMAELIDLIPVQLINSNCHHLIDSSPAFRRKYLDWGVFYQANDFLRCWRDYNRILKQRNAALRAAASKQELIIWTEQLLASAAELDALRQTYLQQLIPILLSTLEQLIIIPSVAIKYYRGWDADQDFEQVLSGSLARDRQLGFTQFGPHRADIKVTVNRVPAKDILSRGQQKMFACGMILAQGILLNNKANRSPIYLVDDLPAELDATSRTNVINLLVAQQAQVFVTAVERTQIDESKIGLPMKMFHVEHGSIREM